MTYVFSWKKKHSKWWVLDQVHCAARAAVRPSFSKKRSTFFLSPFWIAYARSIDTSPSSRLLLDHSFKLSLFEALLLSCKHKLEPGNTIFPASYSLYTYWTRHPDNILSFFYFFSHVAKKKNRWINLITVLHFALCYK